MKTTSRAKIAALAFGLGLAAAPAFAADDQGRDRNDHQPVVNQPQDHPDGDKGDRGKQDRKGPKVQQHRTPSAMHRTDWNNNNNNNNNGNSANDNNNNNNNDRRFNNDNRRDDNNVRGDNNRRSHFDVTQYRRNLESPKRFRIGVYHAPRNYHYRRWSYGQRLPIEFYARDYWLLDYVAFGLFAPPEGYVWVRYGDDALLIDTETGEIIQVRYDVFYS